MNAKIIVTPKGERLAILPAEEYEDMRDALIHANAMANFQAGEDEGLSLAEMQALLAAPTPLAFWRAHRGLSEASLASATGIAEGELAAYESGASKIPTPALAALAGALSVDVEELSGAE